MPIEDKSLGEEEGWIITLCSGNKGKVLSAEREYELIKAAQRAIRPEKDPKKTKKDSKTKRWVNKPAVMLKKYQENLKRRPALKASLQKRAREGDKAITELLEHNYRLIISVAKKFQNKGLSWGDMIQQGSDGFIYAVAKFNTGTGNKLSTYATQWIRQRISRSIENIGRSIRIPIHMQSKITEIKYIYRKHVQLEQERPTSEEIAELYNLNYKNKKGFKPMTKEEAEELGRYLQTIGSLDEPAGEDDNLSALYYIGDENPGPEQDAQVSMDKSYLNTVLCTLPSGDRIFIQFKYGLVDNSPKSDAKTAEAFKITMKEVKEREARILQDLSKVVDRGKFSPDAPIELFSVILISAPSSGGRLHDKEASSVLGKPLPKNLPAKVYESTDKDQMLLLCKRFIDLGCRAEVLSSF